MGGGVDAVVQLAEALKASQFFTFFYSDKTQELFTLGETIGHNTQWQNLFRLQCAPHTSTMTLSPAPTPNGWDPLATKGARQQ